MNNEIIVAAIAFFGTVTGSGIGLVNYRLKQLEKKVDKHNCIVQKTYILEEKMKVANHRIKNLEDKNS